MQRSKMQATLHEQATTCRLDAVAHSVHIDQKYIAEAVLPEMQEWLQFVKEEQKSSFSLLFQL